MNTRILDQERMSNADWADTGEPAPEVPPDHARALGTLIRQRRALTDAQIEAIREYQQERGLRFGDAAVELAVVTREDVNQALAQQYFYPYMSSASPECELVAASQPFGKRAEVFRELRSQLIASSVPHRHVWAVVSASEGVGKSYVAANLAVTFSQLGERTLVVDANMRAPRLHEIFGVSTGTGLSELLVGRSRGPALSRVPDLPNLYLVQAGPRPPNPLELVQRSTFERLASSIGQFQHIIVDTPSASVASDALVIASACGGALMVGRQGHCRLRDLGSLAAELARRRVPVAGVVMNYRESASSGSPAKRR